MSTSLSAIKAQSKARDAEDARLADRKRALLVLIQKHLADAGYGEAAALLERDAGAAVSRCEPADNIDLLTILQEYEEYYEFKFGRKPKLIRRAEAEDAAAARGGGGAAHNGPSVSRFTRVASGAGASKPPAGRTPTSASAASSAPAAAAAPVAGSVEDTARGGTRADGSPGEDGSGGIGISGIGVGTAAAGARRHLPGAASGRPSARGLSEPPSDSPAAADPAAFFERRVLKPLPDMGSSEMRELAAAISRDIYTHSPDIRWESIAGLDSAKRLLKEAVVMPVRYPQLFQGMLAPWKGILLYGPPGTGKTMLAKAVATECRTTFFNISASSIISKWRGESEKLVRVLFELARYHAPSTVFLDELDALMGQRGGGGDGGGGSEHEASRRMKTELLIQMDGLAKSSELVFLLAATNLPWELDTAMLRRLEKRILVPLPCAEARAAMLQELLPPVDGPEPEAGALAVPGGPRRAPDVPLAPLAARLEGYSGSDVFLVAKEAAMRPLRRVLAAIEAAGEEAAAGAAGIAEPLAAPVLGPVTAEDLAAAVAASKPTAHLYADRYTRFAAEYGQVGGLSAP